MFLVSLRSCLRSIHWSQVLSWEWRCSWSSADRRCSNYIWVINNYIGLLFPDFRLWSSSCNLLAPWSLNSLWPSNTMILWCLWTLSSLFQLMVYVPSHYLNQVIVNLVLRNLIELQTFSFEKLHWKMSSVQWWPFYLGRNVSMDRV